MCLRQEIPPFVFANQQPRPFWALEDDTRLLVCPEMQLICQFGPKFMTLLLSYFSSSPHSPNHRWRCMMGIHGSGIMTSLGSLRSHDAEWKEPSQHVNDCCLNANWMEKNLIPLHLWLSWFVLPFFWLGVQPCVKNTNLPLTDLLISPEG